MTSPLPPEREGSTRPGLPPGRAGEGLCDNAYDRTPTERARQLRNSATPAERKLWTAIRNRQLTSTRFNRQVAIGPYICDFVARSCKLVVELDGGQHADAVAYDTARTDLLIARGYRVMRFWNDDVMDNLEGVVRTIEQALLSPPAGAGGVDSPQASGGGPVRTGGHKPSPSALRASSPPAPAGGEK